MELVKRAFLLLQLLQLAVCSPSITLVTIAKNEEKIIDRMLLSVVPYIDHYVVCDTGSTDSTRALVSQFFADAEVPGFLLQHAWVDFGYNRGLCVAEAERRSNTDYLLLADADWVLHVTDEAWKDSLALVSNPTAYWIEFHGDLKYDHFVLLPNKLGWHFEGALLLSTQSFQKSSMETVWFEHKLDGHQRQLRKARDIERLTATLEQTPGDSHSQFLLARAYESIGEPMKAYKWYQERIDAGNLNDEDDEYWYSLYRRATTLSQLESDWSIVRKALFDAFKLRPNRIEPLYRITRHYLYSGRHYALAYGFALSASTVIRPSHGLFLMPELYEFSIKDELSVAAFYIGKKESYLQSLRLGAELLGNDSLQKYLSDDHRARLVSNMAFSVSALHRKYPETDDLEERFWDKYLYSQDEIPPEASKKSGGRPGYGAAGLSWKTPEHKPDGANPEPISEIPLADKDAPTWTSKVAPWFGSFSFGAFFYFPIVLIQKARRQAYLKTLHLG